MAPAAGFATFRALDQPHREGLAQAPASERLQLARV